MGRNVDKTRCKIEQWILFGLFYFTQTFNFFFNFGKCVTMLPSTVRFPSILHELYKYPGVVEHSSTRIPNSTYAWKPSRAIKNEAGPLQVDVFDQHLISALSPLFCLICISERVQRVFVDL